MPVSTPDLGSVHFRSLGAAPVYDFTARLGDASPTITAGFGGWSIVKRVRRRGLLQWDGNDPLAIDIKVLFDNFRAGTSLEDDILQLELMAGLTGTQPPYIQFNSAGVIPHDLHDGDIEQNIWAITNLSWGDADRNDSGNRIRQAVTITVSIAVLSAALSSALKKKAAAAAGTVVKGKYTVKAGDTLSSIAARKNVAGGWHALASLNNIRDPKAIKTGQVLKLP